MKRFLNESDLRPKERGPDGRWVCRWCGSPIDCGRTSYCSQACSDEYGVRSSGRWARILVRRRDGGVCALCGKYDNLWEADHTVPVSEGGDGGLGNLRTLCRICHNRETGLLRRRLNAKAKGQAIINFDEENAE